jgi:hypothetical protein
MKHSIKIPTYPREAMGRLVVVVAVVDCLVVRTGVPILEVNRLIIKQVRLGAERSNKVNKNYLGGLPAGFFPSEKSISNAVDDIYLFIEKFAILKKHYYFMIEPSSLAKNTFR